MQKKAEVEITQGLVKSLPVQFLSPLTSSPAKLAKPFRIKQAIHIKKLKIHTGNCLNGSAKYASTNLPFP